MSGITEIVCALFASCFLLGIATRRNWQKLDLGADSTRPWALGLGWALLTLSAGGFILRFGWEVGIAWFLLWFGLAATAATIWTKRRVRAWVWT